MINIDMKTKSAFNKNSVLSINMPGGQNSKNKNNIKTIMQKAPDYAVVQNNSSINNYIEKCIPKQQPGGQNVQKGQKVMLAIPDNKIEACFGWNCINTEADVDVSAFLIGENEKVLGDNWFVFYGQPYSPEKSTQWISECNIDRQKIKIDFKRVHTSVKKIVFVLTINEALQKKLHFGMIKDAYIRILDSSGKELLRFVMTEYYTNIISMMIGEIYIHNGKWKFNAIGNGIAKDLAGLCEWYGVQVI